MMSVYLLCTLFHSNKVGFRSLSSILVKPDRPLATINKILSKRPIPGNNDYEVARIKGWDCVIKKNEFDVNDLCIYFTIGCRLPSEYALSKFLPDENMKTLRIHGVISQGVVAKLDWLEEFQMKASDVKVGDDVTDVFQVKQWVSLEEKEQYPEQDVNTTKASNSQQSPFPSYVPKTAEGRIQNEPELLDQIRDEQVVITRKEDGCSATYIHNNDEFLICSRNCIITRNKGHKHYKLMSEKYKLQDKLTSLRKNIAIQGEIIGGGINKNRLRLRDKEFRVFNIYDIDACEYYSHDEVETLCKELEIPAVPVLYKGLARDNPCLQNSDNLISYASSLEYGPDLPAEGIVVKVNKRGPRMSFKANNNEYLLKYNI